MPMQAGYTRQDLNKINVDKREANYSTTRTLIQRPYKIKPWGSQAGTKSQGGVWISMKPNKILDQYSKGAGAISSVEGTEEFLFLAPLALNETISHTWEEYESVASRLAQKNIYNSPLIDK